jgi:Flp pilus assembly protein TadG
MRRVNGERGVAVILVVLLMTALLGMAALVLDVGALTKERRELQNGADAAALAIAQECAGGTCPTTLAARSTAQAIASRNAKDGTTTVDEVTIDTAIRSVTVVTSTRTADGGTVLPYRFAQVLTGQEGRTLHARATARWGPAARARVLRLTMNLCDFNKVTNSGTELLKQTAVVFHSDRDCSGSPSGKDNPGAFGWLEGSSCDATLREANAVVEVDPGNNAECDPFAEGWVGETAFVPIFEATIGKGGKAIYTIKGFGAFHLTGYRFPGAQFPTANPPCKPPSTCIAGWFTQQVIPVGELGTGASLGAVLVQLTA